MSIQNNWYPLELQHDLGEKKLKKSFLDEVAGFQKYVLLKESPIMNKQYIQYTFHKWYVYVHKNIHASLFMKMANGGQQNLLMGYWSRLTSRSLVYSSP